MEPETAYFLAPFVVGFGTFALGLYLGVGFILTIPIACAWAAAIAAVEWK